MPALFTLPRILTETNFILRLHHDGRGITQEDFEKLNKSPVGLGLKTSKAG